MLTGEQQTILVVDDDMLHRRLAKLTLERAGYTVVAVPDAQQALEHLAAADFALAVVDVQLSAGMNGLELVTRIKADAAIASLPIMLLSAHAQSSEVSCGLKTGADCYMTKPYDAYTLIANVKSCLAARQQSQ